MPATITANEDEFDFITLKGVPHDPQLVLGTITRAGVDGEAARKQGYKGRRFELIGQRDCDDLAAANDLQAELEALQGQLVGPIVDDQGFEIPQAIVWEVQVMQKIPLIAASGGLSDDKGALLIVRFLVSNPAQPIV